MKQKHIELFQKGRFNLHKWHSNVPSLQSSNTKSKKKLAYAKENFGNTIVLTKILVVVWDKNHDNVSVDKPEFNKK